MGLTQNTHLDWMNQMGMKKSYLFIAIGFFALAFALIGVMAMDYEPEIEQLPFAYVEIAKPPQITMQDNKIIIQPEIFPRSL